MGARAYRAGQAVGRLCAAQVQARTRTHTHTETDTHTHTQTHTHTHTHNTHTHTPTRATFALTSCLIHLLPCSLTHPCTTRLLAHSILCKRGCTCARERRHAPLSMHGAGVCTCINISGICVPRTHVHANLYTCAHAHIHRRKHAHAHVHVCM